jgi:methionine-rich copper-binding protein CopC
MSRVMDRKRYQGLIYQSAIFLLITFLTSFGGMSSAFAHAEIVSSNPASGSVLVEGPESITLSWSEEITTEASQIRVIDSFGVAQTSELKLSVIEDRTTAVLTLSERLPAGNWSITWRVVSADGHLVGGLIPFTVGVLDGGDMSAYSVDDSSIITSSNSRLDRGVEAVTWIGLLISAGLLLGSSYYFSLLMF